MKRRTFIAGLGSAAAWPVVTRAQQRVLPVIGFLNSGAPTQFAPLMAAFKRGLSDAGFVEGRNVTVEYRWAMGQYSLLSELAADLVRRDVSVIAASKFGARRQGRDSEHSNRVHRRRRSSHRWSRDKPEQANRQCYGLDRIQRGTGREATRIGA
jgi:hypothetical protein